MGKLSHIVKKLRATIKDHPVNWELITCYDCWHLVERGTRCQHCGCQNWWRTYLFSQILFVKVQSYSTPSEY